MSKMKIKCASESDYKVLKDYFNDVGILYSQKDGKSLKVFDIDREKIENYCQVVGVSPISVKETKKRSTK